MVTNIKATTVVIQFTAGFTGHTSITHWFVEAQEYDHGDVRPPVDSDDAAWLQLHTATDGDITSLTVPHLRPHCRYRLRLVAENVAGRSNASHPTGWFQTLPAPPSGPPKNLVVRAVNSTALQLLWTVR